MLQVCARRRSPATESDYVMLEVVEAAGVELKTGLFRIS